MNSKERRKLRDEARAKRVAYLRGCGVSVKETAAEVDCQRDQVRTLQLLGQRLIEAEK